MVQCDVYQRSHPEQELVTIKMMILMMLMIMLVLMIVTNTHTNPTHIPIWEMPTVYVFVMLSLRYYN